jgi:hypothetical protein
MTLSTLTAKAGSSPASGRKRTRRNSTEGLAMLGLAALASVETAQAHMEISNPGPRRSKFNPLADPATIDYNMMAPLAVSLSSKLSASVSPYDPVL